ncbi:MAG: ribosome small subunit-dependent GTPase A [Acutalibacteraceae bacterium]|nr:ribosome small subunit-dependent GTPase A [Acutalibacteraceae bacterium]
MNGLIIKALSGFYYVSVEDTVYECKPRGVFRKNNDDIFVGDMVEISLLPQDKGVIENVLPRKNFLSRPPVANIDKMFIISSYVTPAPNTVIIDTMTAIAEDKGIEPIIVFNKSDMGDFSQIADIYRSAGFKVYIVSATNNIGIDELRAELYNSVSVFTGNSGVGKSSILNALFGKDFLKTGEVNEKLGRGRHTTRHTELFSIENGGFIADTPGFSSISIEQSDVLYKENLQYAFREFEEHLGNCRFTSCSHTCEKGCAVIDAVNEGKISKSRFESYKMLYSELSKRSDWEIKKNK